MTKTIVSTYRNKKGYDRVQILIDPETAGALAEGRVAPELAKQIATAIGQTAPGQEKTPVGQGPRSGSGRAGSRR